ncbi:MAG: hypothetical protein JJ913_15780 [Rhizobiaceae bacterium]|nr:hypothetical protein [Rhizobiaceae bacterium]
MSSETIVARLGETYFARGASIRIGQWGEQFVVDYDFGVTDSYLFSTHAEAIAKAAEIFARGHVSTITDKVEEDILAENIRKMNFEQAIIALFEEAGIAPEGDITEVVVRPGVKNHLDGVGE